MPSSAHERYRRATVTYHRCYIGQHRSSWNGSTTETTQQIFKNPYNTRTFVFRPVLASTINIIDQFEVISTPGDTAHEKPLRIPPRCLQNERAKQSRLQSLLRESRQAAPLHAHIPRISRPAMRHPPTTTSRRESANSPSIEARDDPQLRWMVQRTLHS